MEELVDRRGRHTKSFVVFGIILVGGLEFLKFHQLSVLKKIILIGNVPFVVGNVSIRIDISVKRAVGTLYQIVSFEMILIFKALIHIEDLVEKSRRNE